MLKDCTGTRDPKCTSYARTSEMMLWLGGRRQSAVERPDEVALEGAICFFALRCGYLQG